MNYIKLALSTLPKSHYRKVQDIKRAVHLHKGVYLMDTEIIKMAIDTMYKQEVKDATHS
jgi:hypothetical protein